MAFEVKVTKYVPKTVKVKISTEKEKFCQLYAKDYRLMGDATKCYMEAYDLPKEEMKQAQELAKLLLEDDIINQRINDLISEFGFNDQNVDKQHLFIINQFKDLPSKMKAIQEYNKLKRRVDNKLELVLPKPIMDLTDDRSDVEQLPPDNYKVIDVNNDE